MKKLLFASLFFFPLYLHAELSDPQVIQEKTFVIHLTTTIAAATTSYMELVDLSTTSTLYPHINFIPADQGEIDISGINISVDKLAASSETVKIGVCTFVNSSTGSISYFFNAPSAKNVSNTNVVTFDNFSPAFYKTKVILQANTDGLTPFILTNEKESGITTIASTTTIPSIINPTFPKAGDIIIKFVNFDFTNTINYVVDVWYHAER